MSSDKYLLPKEEENTYYYTSSINDGFEMDKFHKRIMEGLSGHC